LKFLIDNALPPRLAELLQGAGYDAIHVKALGMHAAKDEQILARALNEDRIVVSADTDFGTLLAMQDARAPSFILFRETNLMELDGVQHFEGTMNDQAEAQVPIVREGSPGRSLNLYIFRHGCKVVFYSIENLENDPLHREFQCEPAAEKVVQVKIENHETLAGDLYAWVSYDGALAWRMPGGELGDRSVRFGVGVFPISSDGTFMMPLPDFGNDPVLKRVTGEENAGTRKSCFRILVHSLRGGSVQGHLDVYGRRPNGAALEVAPEYPAELRMRFVERR